MANETDYTLYPYNPNKGAPIFFAILFAISTAYHIWQNIKYKAWRITGSLPWGSLLFVAGFVMQTFSIYKDHDLGIYIAKVVLFLFAPPVYSLTNYFVLGRVLFYVPYLSPIHPGRVMSTFVGLDVIVGILTGNGGARSANSSNTPAEAKTGVDMVRASIVLQLACFVGFVALEAVFHARCIKAKIVSPKLRNIITLLYVSSALILVRNIYRVVEVWEGVDSYLFYHEAFFYVFDGALMLVNTLMWNVWHPMEFLPIDNKIYLSKDGKTELKGPGWVDKRPFLVTLFDPFDIIGLIKGRDKASMFWENEEKHRQVEAAGVLHEEPERRV